jgi:GWxTD domain-containing protein
VIRELKYAATNVRERESHVAEERPMITPRRMRLNCAALVVACLAAAAAQAQQQSATPTTAKEIRRGNGERDIDKFRRLDPYFRAWLNEDAVFLLSAQERSAFLDLSSDDERHQFIAQFWDRRNPNPGSLENAFEEEHYRRIVYANEHFGEAWAGWKSDRGRLYVAVGPPDEVESSAAGSDCFDRATSNQVIHDAPARFTWKYRNLHGSGEDFEIWFLQQNFGDPNFAKPTFAFSREPCRFAPNWPEGAPEGIFAFMLEEQSPYASGQLSPRATHADAERHPQNLDLETLLNSHARRSQFPLRIESNVTRATRITSVASVHVAIPSAAGGAAIYGRFVNEASGKVESQFELSVFPIRSEPRASDWTELCDKSVPLPAGTYELQIAVKDATTGKFATHYSKVSAESSTQTAKSATP